MHTTGLSHKSSTVTRRYNFPNTKLEVLSYFTYQLIEYALSKFSGTYHPSLVIVAILTIA